MEDKKVVISRIVDAPVEKVFNAWTDAEQMKQWYSPEGMTTPDASSDPKQGGAYAVTMQMGEQIFHHDGIYEAFDAPHKIAFTWDAGSRENPMPTLVTVLFKSVGNNQTEITLTHTGFDTEQNRVMHEQGWNGTMNKLGKYIKE